MTMKHPTKIQRNGLKKRRGISPTCVGGKLKTSSTILKHITFESKIGARKY